jgi:hypothetical protein
MPLSWLSGLERQRNGQWRWRAEDPAGLPVELRTDDEAAAYGRYAGAPSQADLERVFFLDDENLTLVDRRRREHMKPGFRAAAGDGPVARDVLGGSAGGAGAVLDFVAGQLGMSDPSQVRV